MSVAFDRATGVLRLDATAFEQLVGLEPGDTVPHELEAAGVVTGDAVHPLVAPLLQAVRRPLCQVRIAVRTRAGDAVHQMWLTPEVTAALLPLRDHSQLVGLGTAFVPAAAARAVDLRPRRRIPGDAFAVPGPVIDALLYGSDNGSALAEHAPPAWAACASAWRSGDWRLWTAEATWPNPDAPEGLAGRGLTVLDSGSGQARIEAAGNDRAQLVPSTPTSVWRGLVALLPDDDEAATAAAELLQELTGD